MLLAWLLLLNKEIKLLFSHRKYKLTDSLKRAGLSHYVICLILFSLLQQNSPFIGQRGMGPGNAKSVWFLCEQTSTGLVAYECAGVVSTRTLSTRIFPVVQDCLWHIKPQPSMDLGGKAFWENVTLTLCTIWIQMEMLHERNGYFPVSGVAIPPTP